MNLILSGVLVPVPGAECCRCGGMGDFGRCMDLGMPRVVVRTMCSVSALGGGGRLESIDEERVDAFQRKHSPVP